MKRDSDGLVPMHWGAWNGSIYAFKKLKEAEADISVKATDTDALGRI